MTLESLSTVNGGEQAHAFRYVVSISDQQRHVLELSVDLLIARTKMGDCWDGGFADVDRLLETVPMSTVDFNSAKCRLANAWGYSGQAEFGAAAFELRALRGMLMAL
jgi:hypothetical protein